MTQLIINGTPYPEATRDRYRSYTRDVGDTLRMADGSLVTEIAYTVAVIEYNYDYFESELMNTCLADLKTGADLQVMYLPPGGDELVADVFTVTTRPSPLFAFSKQNVPYWHNISFTLESVNPID